VQRLGISYSFPDWIVSHWLEQFSEGETAQLCEWFNQSPPIDLRVNPLQATLEAVEIALAEAEIPTTRVPYLPQALRLKEGGRSIPQLPGYAEGWWTVQDSSAQLVTHLLDPQPGETIIDACAAPGGKTTHIAERMGDRGSIWACDRTASRLRKLQANCQRLQLHSIRLRIGDSRRFCDFAQLADRVLLDAPCSGLGTLHRKPDIRWRQTPDKLAELSQLQQELLAEVAAWVKPKGILVYATCTLNPRENERVIQTFLDAHPDWQIQPPPANFLAAPLAAACGWIKVLPHQHEMDGFFMVKLQKR
jgi:16S rRNA (cytosine967-C5)-methyltransferase